MAKSSYAAALFLAGWGAHAAAQPPSNGPVTADAAMKRYRQWLQGSEQGCAPAGESDEDEILVCGRHSFKPPELSPLPISREPGEIVRHANDLPSAGEALAGGGCIRLCQQPVTVNSYEVISAFPKIIHHILHGDD